MVNDKKVKFKVLDEEIEFVLEDKDVALVWAIQDLTAAIRRING